jgi:hypothetical protein
MSRSNCFVFAWWMFFTRGGYIAVRKSRHITGFHWLWSADLKRWLHYEPIKPKKLPYVIWDKLWFHGRIKRDDKEYYASNYTQSR